MNWYYHNKIGLDMVFFWKKMCGFIPALLVICLFGYGFVSLVDIQGWRMLIAAVLLYSAVYGAVMWCLAFNADEKKLVYSLAQKLCAKRKKV